MRNPAFVLCALALSLALLPAAVLAEDVVVREPSIETAAAPQAGDKLMPRGITPLVAELLRLVEAERVALAEIRTAISQTGDPERRLELQRQIEALKRDTQRYLLRTQIEYARREGRAQAASELETALLRLDGVPLPAAPVPTSKASVPTTQTP